MKKKRGREGLEGNEDTPKADRMGVKWLCGGRVGGGRRLAEAALFFFPPGACCRHCSAENIFASQCCVEALIKPSICGSVGGKDICLGGVEPQPPRPSRSNQPALHSTSKSWQRTLLSRALPKQKQRSAPLVPSGGAGMLVGEVFRGPTRAYKPQIFRGREGAGFSGELASDFPGGYGHSWV